MWQNVLSNWLRIARMREVCARVSKDIGRTSRKWPKGDFKTVDERRVNICVERIDSQADVWEDERYAHQLRFYLGYRINIEYIITRNLVGNEAFCRKTKKKKIPGSDLQVLLFACLALKTMSVLASSTCY